MSSDVPDSISKLFSGDEIVSMVLEPSSFKPKMHSLKLIITNRRILIYKPGFIGAETEEYPFESIDKIDHKKGFIRSEIEIHAGGKEIELENISNDDAVKAIGIIRQNMHAQKLAQKTVVLQQPVQATPPQEDPVTKLKQLKGMVEAGLITQDEYDKTKAAILAKM
ncbi:MAG: PH domain-containing protein [Methanothrix sp.]